MRKKDKPKKTGKKTNSNIRLQKKIDQYIIHVCKCKSRLAYVYICVAVRILPQVDVSILKF